VTSASRNLLARMVAAFDRRQRRRLGIWEFSDDPRCILRVGITTARIGAELADGTVVRPGDAIGVIHFWNERMPPIPATGADLAWARAFRRALTTSFGMLVRYMLEEPALDAVSVFGGELPLPFTPATVRLIERLGLEMFEPVPPHGLVNRVIDWGSRVWVWLMRYAFNPESVRGLGIRDFVRRPAWITRNKLIELYGPERLSAEASSSPCGKQGASQEKGP
jgi:hypothetical protein